MVSPHGTGTILYLMRHGAAEDVAPSGRDADRTLTPAGRATVRRVALALRDAGAAPVGRIIASPLVRAQETAEIMQSILGPHLDIDTDDSLEPDGSAYDLAMRTARAPHDTLLVGHQPNIEVVARSLLAPLPRATGPTPSAGASALVRMPAGFRTATLVGFHVGGRPPPFPLAFAIDPAALPG